MPVQLLTKQTIKALKTTKDSQTFWDSSFRGSSFGVRVYRSGSKKYVFQYRTPAGRQKYLEIGDVLFKPLAEAREAALKLAARVKAGEDPATEKAEKKGAKTFSEIVAEFRAIYYRDLQLAPKTTANYDSRLDLYLLPKFGLRLGRWQLHVLAWAPPRAASFLGNTSTSGSVHPEDGQVWIPGRLGPDQADAGHLSSILLRFLKLEARAAIIGLRAGIEPAPDIAQPPSHRPATKADLLWKHAGALHIAKAGEPR